MKTNILRILLVSACIVLSSDIYADSKIDIDAEISVSNDDNLNRTAIPADEVDSNFTTGTFGLSYSQRIDNKTFVKYSSRLKYEIYNDAEGMDSAELNTGFSYHHKPSLGFSDPTFIMKANFAVVDFETDIRDRTEFGFGTIISSQLTNKLSARGGASVRLRESDSRIHDTSEIRFFINADILLAQKLTGYATFSFITGDVVSIIPLSSSTSNETLDTIRIADEIEFDPTFGSDQIGYRFAAKTRVLNAGINYRAGRNQSLDVSFRTVHSEADSDVDYESSFVSFKLHVEIQDMTINSNLYTYLKSMLLCFSIILTACDRENTQEIFDTVELSTPNKFLQYPNMYASLPAGSYKAIAATASAGESGNFSLTITYDDQTTTTHTGSWLNSGGQDETSSNNPAFNFTLTKAGGIKLALSSNIDNYLYLLDRNNAIVAEDNDTGTGTNAAINLYKSQIDNDAWATAYYAAIDPGNERDTLSKWKTINGFDQGHDAHVIFRDTKDLGYGRSMFMRQNGGCVAIYVENFAVNLIDGLPYNTLNLTAAIEDDRLHHFGTNAIEFSDLDGDCDGADPKFAKFYTFVADPTNPNTDEPRLLKVDLDNRGEKHMPIPCITCHGGSAKPLLPNGSFPSAALPGATAQEVANRVGDTRSRLQPLEVDSFEYSDKPGYSRAEQEAALKLINEAVFSTFPATTNDGEWPADFIREVVDGWYSGHFLTATNTNAFDGTFVPSGWQHDPGDNMPPPSAEELFIKVIKPYCFACHSKRGSTLGANANASGDGKDINFSSYEKFITHTAQIEDYVYKRGIMPMSRLTYDKFWESDAPEILASHIPGFSLANTDGSINQPGAPIAEAGLDRTVVSPVTLSGASSAFANSYAWQITSSPMGSIASFDDASYIRPVFTADTDGAYVIELVVSNGIEQSAADQVTITIDSTLTPAQSDLTFTTDIQPVLTTTCAPACHTATGIAGVPLYYDATSNGLDVYSNVRQRLNFSNPEYSPLILKPSGNHHFGDNVIGADYNTFVNWILEGAREN